ncbi:MAG TPA: polysaccharide biosynthesis/export family protein [Gemmataceae bacterium]|nr:polysaccharide biosynthesis/export family protein [Gemmataceae bacterium]
MARRRKMGSLAGVLALVAAGCSALPGRGLTTFPEGHKLTDTAKELRAAYPTPLPLPRELDKRPLPPYTVEPGDVLLVQAADLDSPLRLPGDQPVMPDGTITLGRYGRVQVAGKTVDEIEAVVRGLVEVQLKDAKEKDVGPIVVRVVTRVSKVYYVLGEVNAPGSCTLNGRETVLDGILAAGGLNDRASRRSIVLSRPTRPDGCRVVLPICYREIVQLGDTSTNYQLLPGDRIFVPTRTLWEEMRHNKPECPPCGRAQHACPNGTGGNEGVGIGDPEHGPPPVALPTPR